MHFPPLITASQLYQRLQSGDTKLRIFDASWHMPKSDKNAKEEYAQQHLPGALFFDFDKEICDQASTLPHTLPSPEFFATAVQKLGCSTDSLIVCYDTHGIFTAPRVWWMFRVMGHMRVCVLDGGLPAWLHAGYPLTSEVTSVPMLGNFVANFQPDRFADAKQVATAAQDDTAVILDNRTPERFSGTIAEPRPGVRSGHIPCSRNLFFGALLEDGFYLPQEKLKKLFADIPANKPLISSCGSGITACILALAADLIDRDPVRVFDGSWAEWGSDQKLPIVTGDQ